MKKILLLIAIFLTNSIHSNADSFDCHDVLDGEMGLGWDCGSTCYNSPCDCNCSEVIGTVDLGFGYRQDHLKFNTFSRFSPQTRIEEKWNRLPIGIIEANAGLLFCEHFLLFADGDYGWVCRGRRHFKNTDLAHQRVIQDLSSSSIKGYVWDFSGGTGYQFNLWCNAFSVAPIIGYSYHQQKLKNHHFHNNMRDFDGVRFVKTVLTNSRDSFRWHGPWIGFRTAYQDCRWQYYFDYRFHWARYRAKIEDDLGIITQNQKQNSVFGNEFILGVNYRITPGFWTGLKFDAKIFNSRKHGHSNTANARASLRDLRWNSFTLTLDLGYLF